MVGGGAERRGLQLFPLVHQVADLPHERLMAVDDRLGRGAVVVETRGGHRLFDLADRRFGLGDPRFEPIDLRAPRLFGARASPRLGVRAFLLATSTQMARLVSPVGRAFSAPTRRLRRWGARSTRPRTGLLCFCRAPACPSNLVRALALRMLLVPQELLVGAG